MDIKHFKVTLLNTIKKWSWLFKEHLLTYVTNRSPLTLLKHKENCLYAILTVHVIPFSLDDLQGFVHTTVDGLAKCLPKGDYRSLVDVMSHLLAIRDRQAVTDKMFEPLKDTVILLERHGVTIPDKVYLQLEVKECVIYFLYFSLANEEIFSIYPHLLGTS